MSDGFLKSPMPAVFGKLPTRNLRPVGRMIATFEHLGFEPFIKPSIQGLFRVHHV